MSVASTLNYRHCRNTALPFVTASAPTSTNPQFVDGLNLLTSYKGYAERRPGFDVGFESVPTAFTGTIERVFGWRLWGSTFFIMLNEVTPTGSNVYKLALGDDDSFVLIWSSASTNVFDFVVSNNFCFFGNSLDMRKYDGTTVTKWGIDAPSAVTVGPTIAGTGANGIGTLTWTSPTNVTSLVGFATVTVPVGANHSAAQLNATNFGLAVASTATISGIEVTFSGKQSAASLAGAPGVEFIVEIIKGGVVLGVTTKYLGSIPTTTTAFSAGSSTELWSSTWTPADVNAANFGVCISVFNPSSTASTFSVQNVQVTIYATDIAGAGVPSVALSGTGISAVNGGYQYVYSYMNSHTGHVSSPSAASLSTGNFANKTVDVGVTASTDPQVDKIRIFRTPDGGGGIFFEIENSPVLNATTTYPDTTLDINLSLVTAPTFGFNDPPPPGYGFVWFANRIWYIDAANPNTIRFTDWEELNIGVAEESCVSGPAGNYWKFDSESTALSVAQDGVIIFTAGSMFKIDGDSLNTFRRTTIAKGIGCRNRATIARLGAMTAFLANTNSIWTTDSNSLQEISQIIQPTLDGIDHSQASMTFHIQGQNRWLMLFDMGHSQTLCYDTNTQQWMPPWSILGTACTSAETSPGNWDLLIGQAVTNTLLQLTPGAYLDHGTAYEANLKTNPMPIVNEHLGGLGSNYIDLAYPQNPGQIGYVEYLGADFNAILPKDILYEFDDDPATATYQSVIANVTDAPLKTQGINVKNMWYYLRQGTGRRVSWQMVWWPQNSNFKLYTLTLAYRITR